jgi:nucleoside phosphorylase
MYDYGPNSRYFNYWKGGFRGGSAVGSVFLLHELGHQLGDVTHFFNPDAGAKNAARNAANTDRVLKNCF